MSEIVFLIDLAQDVAASRPIARYARAEFGLPVTFIVSAAFRTRDATGLWFEELQEMEAELIHVETVPQAIKSLAGRTGALFSCSESALGAHAFSHGVFLGAPPGLTRVTVQHGLECIGFNHNAAHDRTWRHYVGMACDVAASWFHPDALHSVQADQRAKIVAVGPPFGIDQMKPRTDIRPERRRAGWLHGLVCENLHSVRYGSGAKVAFVDALSRFAEAMDAEGGTIEVRPHPAGRYLEKHSVPLRSNVRLNRLPLYKQSLDRFGFGISSPSSVVLDMVWAGIPVAVWVQGNQREDVGAYRGLHLVSSETDWLDFARAAVADPAPFLARQAEYLEQLPIPGDIALQYRALIAAAAGLDEAGTRFPAASSASGRMS